MTFDKSNGAECNHAVSHVMQPANKVCTFHAAEADCPHCLRRKIAKLEEMLDKALTLLGLCAKHNTHEIAMKFAGNPICPECFKDALRNLEEAAEAFSADQSGATDPRCGLVQPVSVAECEALNAALRESRKLTA